MLLAERAEARFPVRLQRILYGGRLGGSLFRQDFAETVVVSIMLESQRLVDFFRYH